MSPVRGGAGRRSSAGSRLAEAPSGGPVLGRRAAGESLSLRAGAALVRPAAGAGLAGRAAGACSVGCAARPLPRSAREALGRALLIAVCLISLGALVTPSAARAEDQPAILKAYDLDWIERVREEAWPQPKLQRPIICLLDTGVDITPDTPADNPEGPIVARLALDGGTGLAQGTTWEHQHGTQMASIIAAPRNGYGTVGVFPQARIVSIRVTDRTKDEVYITPDGMRRGVRSCANWSAAAGLRIAVVVMAESNYEQRKVDLGAWQDAAQVATDSDALFIAAAGNQADADVVAPAAVGEILTISAGDEKGQPCSFLAGLVQQKAVRGPGCASTGWLPGSSAATAAVGAFAAAMVTRAPALKPAVVRQGLVSALLPAEGAVGRVSGAGARDSFSGFVDDVPVTQASSKPYVSPLSEEADATSVIPRTSLWKPRIRARWHRGKLRIERIRGLDGVLNVRLRTRGSERVVARRGKSFSIAISPKPRAIEFWASGADDSWRSLSARCRL